MNMIMKKLFIIVISNNSPESMTYQKRHLEKKNGEKCIEKWKRYCKENKKRLQKLFVFNTRNYLKKRKIKKNGMVEVDIRMCEEKATKIKRVWKNHRQNMTNKKRKTA